MTDKKINSEGSGGGWAPIKHITFNSREMTNNKTDSEKMIEEIVDRYYDGSGKHSSLLYSKIVDLIETAKVEVARGILDTLKSTVEDLSVPHNVNDSQPPVVRMIPMYQMPRWDYELLRQKYLGTEQ